MAYTFFKANGYTIGKSLVEDDMMPTALEVQEMAKDKGVETDIADRSSSR